MERPFVYIVFHEQIRTNTIGCRQAQGFRRPGNHALIQEGTVFPGTILFQDQVPDDLSVTMTEGNTMSDAS
jgi:hypothetical protein